MVGLDYSHRPTASTIRRADGLTSSSSTPAAVLASVAKTNRLVIAEEGPGQLGWSAALAAIVADEAFDDLDAPVTRVCGGAVPWPAAGVLEDEVNPSARRIVEAVGRWE